MSQLAPFQVIDNQVSGQTQFRQAQEDLRRCASEKQNKCWETLASWTQQQAYCGTVAVQSHTDTGELAAYAALLPCDIVSQWASRQPIQLLLPIYATSSVELNKLLRLACDYVQQQDNDLGILYFSHELETLESLGPKYRFVNAWEYVLTISFPIDEKAAWILPLSEIELQRHAGEVELPRELATIWDCINLP